MTFRILTVFVLLAVPAYSESNFAEAGRAAPEYFAEFYSFQGAINFAAQSHTFARFFKMENGVMTDVVDISWLPQPGNFRRGNRMPLLRAVPGHNYNLGETFGLAGGKAISSQGQFPISPALFDASKRRKAELDSGRYDYKLTGAGGLNCIEALSGVLGHLPTGLSRGAVATSKVVDFFLASGQMGSQWRKGAVQVVNAPPTTNSPSGYRIVAAQPSPQPSPVAQISPLPLTHSSNGAVVYAPQPVRVAERRPVLFPNLRRR